MDDFYKIKDEYVGDMRFERLDNDLICMATAVLWASRSKDPSSQVGACFVNEEGRIISIGYNGAPNNWDDEKFPWGRDTKKGQNLNNTKYPYVIHAEMNAILNYMGQGSDFKNSTVFVTLFPCNECAKFLAQRGIKRVVYLSDKYKLKEEELEEKFNSDPNIASKRVFEYCGVEYIPFESINKNAAELLKLSLEPDKGIEMVRAKDMRRIRNK